MKVRRPDSGPAAEWPWSDQGKRYHVVLASSCDVDLARSFVVTRNLRYPGALLETPSGAVGQRFESSRAHQFPHTATEQLSRVVGQKLASLAAKGDNHSNVPTRDGPGTCARPLGC